jgi:hypothetical protein
MKKLIAMLIALGLAAPFASLAFAEPTDQASCEDEGMQWDEDTQTCFPPD